MDLHGVGGTSDSRVLLVSGVEGGGRAVLVEAWDSGVEGLPESRLHRQEQRRDADFC